MVRGCPRVAVTLQQFYHKHLLGSGGPEDNLRLKTTYNQWGRKTLGFMPGSVAVSF